VAPPRKYATEEERREARRASQRRWAERNRDKIKAKQERSREAKRAYDRERYQRLKEEVKARARAYYLANRDRVLANVAKWAAENPEKSRAFKANWKARNPDNARANYVRREYGITLEDERELLAAQDHRCLICGIHESGSTKGRLALDHCHETGQIRGYLCTRCNSGLGQFRDSPALLLAAAEYLVATETAKDFDPDGESE
jgi:hypothetical protein